MPDKFKGTLTARAAAESIARGWRTKRPSDRLDLLPMSDGGDGFGEVMSQLLGAAARRVRTCDAAHRPCTARWWWDVSTRTAIIESACVVGLAMLPHRRYHPFELDTYGLGKLVRAARAKNARRILVGLGGSATNDAGFGLARALGWEFRNAQGKTIERWTDLGTATIVRKSGNREIEKEETQNRSMPEVIVAVDVQNRLLGARGATRVYGPQKGIRPQDFDLAERCLKRLAKLMRAGRSTDLSREPGAGAAGGLGFGFAAFLGGRLEPGFELFARDVKLDRRLRSADLVITGEGAIDPSTLMGKGAGEIARRAKQLGVPCIGLVGTVSLSGHSRHQFTLLHALNEITSLKMAKKQPSLWLERLAALVAQNWRSPTPSRPAARS